MVGRFISYWNSPFLGDMLVFQGVHPFSTKGINFRVFLVFLSRGRKPWNRNEAPILAPEFS